MPEKKNTYLTLHKNFVRTDIEYTDRETGEVRTFNSVTLPKGTVVDGVDVSYYQFSPMFVNESRYRSEYLQSLSEKARGAREGSERLGNGDRRAAQSRESIAM